MGTCMGIFCFGAALFGAAVHVEIQFKGRYAEAFRIITRAKSPVEFWTNQIFGLSFIIFLIVVGILLIAGIIPVDR